MAKASGKVQAEKLVEDKLGDDLAETIKMLDSVTSKETIDELWGKLDANDNDMSSLAEITSFVKTLSMDPSKPPKYNGFFIGLNNKKALLRAYYRTTEHDSKDEDAFVQKDEFPALLRNIYFYNKLWTYFDKIDTDGDARLTKEEFAGGAKHLGVKLSEEEISEAFNKIDTNSGGIILFDEFCEWCVAVCGYGSASQVAGA